MRGTGRFGDGRMEQVLRGLGQDEFVGDLPTVFDANVQDTGMPSPSAYFMSGSAYFDAPGGNPVNPATYPGTLYDSQGRVVNVSYASTGGDPAAAAVEAAKRMSPGETRNVILSDGSTAEVVATNALPSFPDASKWYKVGQQLLKYTGRNDASGKPIYQSQALGMSNTTLLMFAAAAYLLLS